MLWCPAILPENRRSLQFDFYRLCTTLALRPRCKLGQRSEVIFGVSLFILNPVLPVGSDFYVTILCSAYKEVLLLVDLCEYAQNILLQNKLVLC